MSLQDKTIHIKTKNGEEYTETYSKELYESLTNQNVFNEKNSK